jgi:hypothetical protein
MPTENVMHVPTATPSCAMPGGRYSASPGSSSHSCVGANSRSSFSRRRCETPLARSDPC